MSKRNIPSPAPLSNLWALDKEICYLNHGSYGACPRKILERQQEYRNQLESDPLRFFLREYTPLLTNVRKVVANFVQVTPEEITLVTNATTGVNTILKALRFSADDELLVTNHEYNACKNALNAVAELSGAKIIVAEIPFPIASKDQVIHNLLKHVTPRTKFVLIDHVVSQTSLIFPIKEIVEELTQRGIEVLVDGAHAPGMLPLQLKELGTCYYTGNFHKWTCSPKGAAFLYVPLELQHKIRPLVISHGANAILSDRSRFLMEFDWTGTQDPSALLCIPESITFMSEVTKGGIAEVMQANHDLAMQAQKVLCDVLSVASTAPETMLGSMATINLPKKLAAINHVTLHDLLYDSYGIEALPMQSVNTQETTLRISAHLHNSIEQYQYLAEALLKIQHSL